MGRSRSLVILAGLLLAGLCLPAAALAGTYSWDLPANFTATASGANPDHDVYGATPWSYVDALAPSFPALPPTSTPSAFRPLDTFGTSLDGGLRGWNDSSDPNALVALNTSGAPIGEVPAGQLAVRPASDRVVAIGWTSPLASTHTVSIAGSFTPLKSCAGTGPTWTLEQNGASIASGSGAIAAPPISVASRASIYLTVDYSGLPLVYDPQCETAAVSLHIAATETTAPSVTLTSPANGALISGGQPTFSGSASTGFGASPTVTVRVYRGASASGTPVQTITTTRSSAGGYVVGPNAALADGQYTAQAEQDDLSSPPDRGFSAPTTFLIHNAAPTITLDSPGARPLTTATPTLTGQAAATTNRVALVIYPGTGTKGTPVRLASGASDSHGHFSIRITPGLPDGQYTAVAAQAGSGATGLSKAVTFRIKVHPPALTLAVPGARSSVSGPKPQFSGAAGAALGDSSIVTVNLYAGSSLKGRRLGTMRVAAHGAQWAGVFPFRLALGRYTARANQTDDAGHRAFSASHTFLVVSGPTVIGSVDVSRSGIASVPITCLAAAGRACAGNVLILTVHSFRPLLGGPAGPVRVLFAYVTIPAGKTEVIRRPMRTDVARALRKLKSVRLRVSTNLTSVPRSSVVRTLRFSR
ncbi:MAG: hypothetical protein QOD66_69 [Solirubrobacteraceae bacterium]|nr:hypothetical protein [Solirubrobacteraceae bacterium]